MKKNILLVCGGDGTEHDISLISAKFIYEKLSNNHNFNIIKVCLHNKNYIAENGDIGYFGAQGQFYLGSQNYTIDVVVPCIHGVPGENGEFQSLLELNGIPYIGCDSQASLNCFNKITTKLYLDALNIPNSPFLIIPDKSDISLNKALEFFNLYRDVYIKAACQGSSIGCYHVIDIKDLKDSIYEAFTFSNEVIMEKTIKHRELEIAAYEIDGQLIATNPGEIITPENAFYTFEEKYNANSQTLTTVTPNNLSDNIKTEMKKMALKAFKGLKLRDLSRIDFFLSDKNEILINEINTFPGMTPISMFPKLLEHNGHDMTEFLSQCVDRAIKRKGSKRLI